MVVKYQNALSYSFEKLKILENPDYHLFNCHEYKKGREFHIVRIWPRPNNFRYINILLFDVMVTSRVYIKYSMHLVSYFS